MKQYRVYHNGQPAWGMVPAPDQPAWPGSPITPEQTSAIALTGWSMQGFVESEDGEPSGVDG